MNSDAVNNSSLPLPGQAGPTDVAHAPASPTASPHGTTPAAAQDADKIEQEWVSKVHQVLLNTRNDPFEQARQLAALRADYMMKRYNKEIKLGE